MGRRKQPTKKPAPMTLRQALLSSEVPFWTGAAVTVLDELPASLALNTSELSQLLPYLSRPDCIPEPYARRAPQIATALRQFPDQRCRDSIRAELVKGCEIQRLHNETLARVAQDVR